jgi:hypothetical protein
VVVLLCVGVALAEKTCPQCGTQNADQAKFCKSCGAKLPEPPPSRPSTPRVSGTVSVSDGVVSISSEPSGASVIIDGRSRGTTPLSVSDLGTGRHELTLSRDGYRDYNTTFTISGQVGTVVVTTEPVGAEVLVDGTSRGRAGEGGLALTRLLYGRHVITVRMDGYQDVTKTIEVRAPGPVAVSFRLGWGKGYLRAESEPSGAEILTGGRSLGTTPLFVEMQPGRYVLTGTRRGHYDWSGFAEVQYAETALVRAIFERVKRPSPLLLGASVAALAGTGLCVLRGEAEYAAYRGATTIDEAVRHRDATQKWDMFRNIGAGATVALGVSFALLRF